MNSELINWLGDKEMTNRIQMMMMATWCKRHGKNLEVGGLEWIRLYAGVFRSIMVKAKV